MNSVQSTPAFTCDAPANKNTSVNILLMAPSVDFSWIPTYG